MILKKGHLYRVEWGSPNDYILVSPENDFDTKSHETLIHCCITMGMPSLTLDIGATFYSPTYTAFSWDYPSISDVFQVARLLKNSKYKYDFKTNKIVHKT